jgi:hypothetical protein
LSLKVHFGLTTYSNDAILNWATSSEQNNDHFTVEKSKSGLDFEDLYMLPGAGSSQQLLKYTYTDKNVGSSKIYYRLRQNDFNGNYDYSNIVVVRTSEISKNSCNIYPMPVVDEMNLNFDVVEDDLSTIMIYDMVGNQVFLQTYMVKTGKNTVTINQLDLSRGMYIVSVKYGSRYFFEKIHVVR